jgi:hypothetical protein
MKAPAREHESITVRMPGEILSWLRKKAALETIERNRQVSINSTIVNVLKREMEADTGKERAKA